MSGNAVEERRKEKRREYQRKYRAANKEKYAAYTRAYYAVNPEKHRERARRRYAANREKEEWYQQYRENKREHTQKWYAANSERAREQHRWLARRRKYGLTQEQWNALFAAQNSCCAICEAVESGSKRGWHTDHCHTSGRVRGILCHHCNFMVGNAKDNPERLEAAARYLRGNHVTQEQPL